MTKKKKEIIKRRNETVIITLVTIRRERKKSSRMISLPDRKWVLRRQRLNRKISKGKTNQTTKDNSRPSEII